MFFDDFMLTQPIAYSLLKNSVLGGKVTHAYLINTNGYDNSYDFIISLVKMLICNHNYSNNKECKNCNICNRIDNKNFPEIKIIESDSLVIKKEQLLELQSEFSRSSIEGNKRIYIIKDCDKMNKSASNSLLKFLEEPVDGIIAILLTNHLNRILSTIVSRCQVIHLENNKLELKNFSSFDNLSILCCDTKDEREKFIDNSSKFDIFNATLNFIDYFEENKFDIFIYIKDKWFKFIKTREDNLLAFKILIYFYFDILNNKLKRNNFVMCSNKDLIDKISSSNSIESILKKLDIVQYGYDMISRNLNINLLLDDIIIKLGDV